MLGKRLEDVSSSVAHKGIEDVYEDLPDSEQNEQCVVAQDGSWEFLLDQGGNISTIFLYAEMGSPLPFGLEARMSPEDVLSILGTPTGEAPESAIPGVGPQDSGIVLTLLPFACTLSTHRDNPS